MDGLTASRIAGGNTAYSRNKQDLYNAAGGDIRTAGLSGASLRDTDLGTGLRERRYGA